MNSLNVKIKGSFLLSEKEGITSLKLVDKKFRVQAEFPVSESLDTSPIDGGFVGHIQLEIKPDSFGSASIEVSSFFDSNSSEEAEEKEEPAAAAAVSAVSQDQPVAAKRGRKPANQNQ